MSTLISRALVALALGVATSMAPAIAHAERRPFSVDDLLRLEDVTHARFSPSSDVAVFAFEPAYESLPQFSRGRMMGTGTRLYRVASADGEAQPLFQQREGDGYELGEFSPDGRFITVAHSRDHAYAVDVYDFRRRRLVRASLGADHEGVARFNTRWVSDHEFLFAATAPGRLPSLMETFQVDYERRATFDRAQVEGDRPTVLAVGSGVYSDNAPNARSAGLALLDARSGAARIIAPGAVIRWSVSPDGRHVAIIRLKAEQGAIRGEALAGTGAGPYGLRIRELAIVDMRTGALRVVCNCAVDERLLAWSPRGDRAVFLRAGEAAAHVAVARVSGEASDLGLEVGADDGATMGWLRERLLIEARRGPSSPLTWHLDDAPITLPSESAVVATHRGEAIALVSGRVAIGADGTQRILFQEPGARLTRSTRQISDALPEGDVLSFNILRDGETREIVSIDLATGAVLNRLGASDDIVAVAPRGDAILTRSRDALTGALQLRNHAAQREVFRFNRALADVAPAERHPIRYAGVGGEPLVSWLLTPDGASGPRPTIVTFYPGTVYSETYQPFTASDFSFINAELLVGHGYNVLFVSVPMSREIPRDVSVGLAAKLDRAVDAAIATGLVDGSRLGLQGHSFGGWGTATVLTQSTRYRTAIALSGLYNLTSFYGAFNSGRFDSEAPYPALNWSEQSQPGLGAPPWRDPERYIRNSPLFRADRIETPLLLIHGDHDWVSVNQAEELFSALVRLDQDAQLVRYYGEDHHISSPANIRDMWMRMFAWYDFYLRP